EARKAFRDSFAIADRRARTNPNNLQWQRDLALGLGRIGFILTLQNEVSQGLSEYRKGRQIIARLKEQSPENAALPQDLAWFDAEISKLVGRVQVMTESEYAQEVLRVL